MPEQRPSIQLAGTSHRLHYSEFDWPAITGMAIDTPNGNWPAGRNLAAAKDVQDATLVAFDEAGKAIIAARADNDLTPEAKQRRVQSAADAYFSRVEAPVKRLRDGMASLAEAAPRTLTSVRPLGQGDMVAELRDQEARAYIRSIEPAERQRLLASMARGEHPELTAGVLRGPALVSGLGPDALASLNRAGIMASYHESIIALRQLSLVRDDVVRTAVSGIQSLAQIDPAASGAANRAQGWRNDEGATELRSWIDAFNLPTTA